MTREFLTSARDRIRDRILGGPFDLAHDKRVHVASRIEDFALFKDPRIAVVTMPNPVAFPEDSRQLEYFMAAMEVSELPDGVPDEYSFTTMQLSQAQLRDFVTGLPQYIEDTSLVLAEAFECAGCVPRRGVFVRRNSRYPSKPHSHDRGGIADILGDTTIFYEGNALRAGRSYSLPIHHVTVFKDITHKAGNLQSSIPRLTMFCS